MSGVHTFKKGALVRNMVKRVIMGPPALFSRELIAEEIQLEPSLKVWAIFLQRANPTNVEHFLETIQPDSDSECLVAYCTASESKNLTSPSAWVERKVLDFGSDATKACWWGFQGFP